MGRARAQYDSRHRHVRLPLVSCARRVQLLVRRIDRGPNARSAQFSAIHRGSGNTIPAIRPQKDAYPDASRGTSFRCDSLRPLLARFQFFLATSDRHTPSKLIKNQNASTIKADKLNLKISETIISSAPTAFSNE